MRTPSRPRNCFVGRAAELARIQQLAESARLISLVGPLGVGKTRLAHEWLEQSRVGYVVVQLDQCSARPPSWADIEQKCGQIGRGSWLLLDDFPCDRVLVASLVTLVRAGTLRCLVTATHPIAVSDEHVVRLAGLEPEADGHPGAFDPAVELFLARLNAKGDTSFVHEELECAPPAKAGRLSAFARRDSSSHATIVDLVERLDRIPALIELAAEACQVMTVEQLCQREGEWQELLYRVESDVEPWQSDLGVLTERALSRISHPTRLVLTNASAFEREFTLGALQGTCDGVSPALVCRSVRELMDHGLMIAGAQGDEGVTSGASGEKTFRLYRHVAAFARERLLTAQDGAAARRRIQSYLLEQLADGNNSAHQAMHLGWSQKELQRLVAASDIGASAFLKLGGLLLKLLSVHGTRNDVEAFARRLLQRCGAKEVGGGKLEGGAVLEDAEAFQGSARAEEATIVDPVMTLDNASPDANRTLWLLLAEHYIRYSELPQARRILQSFEQLDTADAESALKIRVLEVRAQLARASDHSSAEQLFHKLLADCAALGDPGLSGRVLVHYAGWLLERERPQEAEVQHARAFELLLASGESAKAAVALTNWALTHQYQGNFDRAHELFADARKMHAQCRNLRFEGITWADEACLLLRQGVLLRALDCFETSTTKLETVGDDRQLRIASHYYSVALEAAAKHDAAEQWARRAVLPEATDATLHAIGRVCESARQVLAALRAGQTLQGSLSRELEEWKTSTLYPVSDELRLAVTIATLFVTWARTPGSVLLWDRAGGRVGWAGTVMHDWSTKATLRTLFDALATQRLTEPKRGLTREQLQHVCWPAERMLPQAANNRLHVALSKLRKQVLGQALEVEEGSYRIAPNTGLLLV